MSGYFEVAVAAGAEGKATANWLMGEVSATLNRDEKDITDCPIAPGIAGRPAPRIADNTISNKIAKVQRRSRRCGREKAKPMRVIEAIETRAWKQVTDSGAIEKSSMKCWPPTPQWSRNIAARKKCSVRWSPQMKASKGKANPAQVKRIAEEKAGRLIAGADRQGSTHQGIALQVTERLG